MAHTRTVTQTASNSRICPGVEFLLNQNYTLGDFLHVNVSDCVHIINVERKLPPYPAQQGVVYGVCKDSTLFCQVRLKNRNVGFRVYMKRLEYECITSQWKTYVHPTPVVALGWGCNVACGLHSLEERVCEFKKKLYMLNVNSPMMIITIESIDTFEVILKHITQTNGYIAFPHSEPPRRDINQRQELNLISRSMIVMTIQEPLFMVSKISHVLHIMCKRGRELKVCGTMKFGFHITTDVFFEYSVHVFMKTLAPKLSMHPYRVVHFWVFPDHITLQNPPGGLFNCSSVHYCKFQEILQCNLQTQCEDGRDEGEHCPFSSPGCQGMVASHNKCYQLIQVVKSHYFIISVSRRPSCVTINKNLASIKTKKEKKDTLHFFKRYGFIWTMVGLLGGLHSQLFMYSKIEIWTDNTVAYNLDHLHGLRHSSRAPYYYQMKSMELLKEGVRRTPDIQSALCEFQSQEANTFTPTVSLSEIHLTSPMFRNTRQFMSMASGRRFMHSFMLYDCVIYSYTSWQRTYDGMCTAIHGLHNATNRISREFTSVMFKCDDVTKTVHYTLVCDFKKDCPELSDESFCEHPKCPEYSCKNGQCLSHSQRCNEFPDCLNNYDELYCPNWGKDEFVFAKGLYLNLDGTGNFILQLMGNKEPCPDSHYRCTAEFMFCLPVYTRCNGMSDCVYGEDEQDCERATCPGFYQCLDSRVCVHGDHLCDGWGQCPQRDDELMCDMACPQGCLCEGHCFLCSTTFLPDLFPDLRYVDATGTGMSPDDFRITRYLFVLVLSHCSLFNISGINLTNMRYIDFSNNHLDTLQLAHVLRLPYLKSLVLSNNPICHNTNALGKHVNYALRRVSLSQTHPNVINAFLSVQFYHVEHVNLSLSNITTFMSLGFKHAPRLTEVDVRWNPVDSFPWDSLSELMHLRIIFTSDYRFCCRNLFPRHLVNLKCHTPFTVLQACETLLPSELHRILFGLKGIFALVGNIACFLASFKLPKLFEKNVLKAIGYLLFSNTYMGIHVGVTVVADTILHGKYLNSEKEWVNGIPCKVSGFLWLLSSEVSVLVIMLMSLNHLVILRVPEKSKWVSGHRTDLVFPVAWFVGMVLSVIPFLPGLSHWGVHGQSGLCRLAIFTRYGDLKFFKWFTVVFIINFLVSFIIVCIIIIVQKHLPAHRIQLDPTKRSLYFSAHLITKIAVTTSACWLTLGLVLMMSTAGVAALHRVQEAMVVFVLPLHSALCPAIYVWAVLTEQNGRIQEQKMLQILKSKATKEKKGSTLKEK